MKPQRSKPQGDNNLKSKLIDALFSCASVVNCILPTFNVISICSIPDYTDSAKAIFDFLGKNNIKERYLFVWHVKDPRLIRKLYECSPYANRRVIFVRKNHAFSFLLFCFSKYIIDTHGLFSMVKMKNGQKSIYLTHGMPVKKFGFEYENDVKIGVQHADFALATSDFYRNVISRSMGIRIENVIPVGLPRNDMFFLDDEKEESIHQCLSSKYILFLPTYRVSNDRNKNNGKDLNTENLLLGGSMDEWEDLNDTLLNSQKKIVIKIHPLEKHNNLERLTTLSQVIVINDEWIIKNNLSLNLIMKYSDRLITDYSGAFVDYLLTDKPILFYLPDFQEYKESRGYVIDNYLDNLPGAVLTNFSDLRKYINVDDFPDKREVARRQLNTQRDASASAQVCSILFDN